MKRKVIIKKDSSEKKNNDLLSAKENNLQASLETKAKQVKEAEVILSNIDNKIREKRELLEKDNSLYLQKQEEIKKLKEEENILLKKVSILNKNIEELLTAEKVKTDELLLKDNNLKALESDIASHNLVKASILNDIEEKQEEIRRLKRDVASEKQKKTIAQKDRQKIKEEIDILTFKKDSVKRNLQEENEKLENFIIYKHEALNLLTEKEENKKRDIRELEYAIEALEVERDKIVADQEARENDIADKIKLNAKLLSEIKYEAEKFKALRGEKKVGEKLKEMGL